MRSKVVRVGVLCGGALLAFLAGYATGQRTTFAWLTPVLAAEAQFNLTQRVETLARMRTGDPGAAIAGLEQVVDATTVNLAQGKPWRELDPSIQFSLQLAKAYRTKYPPSQPDAALSALLETIPMPDVKYCSTAMQRMLSTE